MYVYPQTVIGCCAILNKVIDPIRKTMPSAPWPELIAKCYSEQVDLSAKFMYVISFRFGASLSGSSSVLITVVLKTTSVCCLIVVIIVSNPLTLLLTPDV